MYHDFVETSTILRSFQEKYYIHVMDNEIEAQKKEVNVHNSILERYWIQTRILNEYNSSASSW